MPWSGIGQPGIGDPFLGAYAAGPPDRAPGPYGWSNPLASFLDLMDQVNLRTGNNDPRQAAILTGVGNYGSGGGGAQGGQGYTNTGPGNPFSQGQGPYGLPGYMMPPWISLIPGLNGTPINLPQQYPGPAGPTPPTTGQPLPNLGPGLPTPTDPFGGKDNQQQLNDLLKQILDQQKNQQPTQEPIFNRLPGPGTITGPPVTPPHVGRTTPPPGGGITVPGQGGPPPIFNPVPGSDPNLLPPRDPTAPVIPPRRGIIRIAPTKSRMRTG